MSFRACMRILFVLILLAIIGGIPSASLAQPPLPPDVAPSGQTLSPDSGPLVQAMQEVIAERADVPAFQMDSIGVERIQYSADGNTALLYLAAVDPTTGQTIAREPGLAIAQRAIPKIASPDGFSASAEDWQIYIQADEAWARELQALPAELLTDDLRERFLSPIIQDQVMSGLTLGGYLLPWAGGQTKSLTWSVSHTSCYPISDCYYAFDFADGTMFPLLASKGGTVFGAKWDVPNNTHDQGTNYIVVKDTSTTPTSYQIYYHLAQESIPLNLRTQGAVVRQGQFIGNADNTGYSSGSHLHFMVTTSSYGLWGPSVDITFRDVGINYDPVTQGGRPRLPKEALTYGGEGQEKYTSANFGTQPPQGGITAPENWLNLSGSSLHVEGWGSDDLGVTKAQIIVNTSSGWTAVGQAANFEGAPLSITYALDADLCAASVPDGPVVVSVRVWDVEGNQSSQPLGTRQVFKHSGCPAAKLTSRCTPAAEQVAVFTQPYYLGDCQVFGVGDYATDGALGTVGEEAASSILVGSSVSVTLYRDASLRGRAETFTDSDANLADHRIGAGTVSSLRVQYRWETPLMPVLLTPPNLTADDSLVLAWRNAGGAEKFFATLSGPVNASYNDQRRVDWPVSNLPAGTYSLQVYGVISNGSNDYASNTDTLNFTISPSSATIPATEAFPYAVDFNSSGGNWTGSGGWAWGEILDPGEPSVTAWRYNRNGTCVDGGACAGDLTSPPVLLPASQTAYLRFDSRWHGETGSPYWDQRLVQIASSDFPNGPYTSFSTLYPLTFDPADTWLTSPVMRNNQVLDLSAFKGKYVRIRFSFNSVDGVENHLSTWTIDNVGIGSTPGQIGSLSMDDSYNATPEHSILITPGAMLQGVLSPGGDMDYFHFNAIQGTTYQVDVTSQWQGSTSTLDPVVALVDWEQVSYLAENDDIDPGVNHDARVSFTARRTDTYYIRVRAWNHPMGGDNTAYRVTLSTIQDNTAPVVSLQAPANANGYVPLTPFILTASASDTGSGIRSVDFYYHPNTWASGHWVKLGSGVKNGSDYTLSVDPATLPEASSMAFMAQATDWAFNYDDAISWPAGYDRTAPVSGLVALPANINGTTFLVQANANDAVAGIEQCELQVSIDGGGWAAWEGTASEDGCFHWYTGVFGHSYAFRARAIDMAGNVEAYPDMAETTTQLVDPGHGDAFEADNLPTLAHQVLVDHDLEMHDFYGIGDEDWTWFEARAGQQYYLLSNPQGGPGGAEISLWVGGSQVAVVSAAQLTGQTLLSWVATVDGRVDVRTRSIDAQVAGSNTAYQTQVITGFYRYLPMVSH